MFPVGWAAIFSLGFSRVPFGRLIALLPPPVKVLGSLLLVYVVADFILMLVLLPGQPIEQGGQYFFNNHGGLTPISLDRYRQGLAHQARLFTGHEIVLYGVATVLALQLDRLRRGTIAVTAPPVPSPIIDLARPAPLSRMVVLETALRPDQCVSQLLAELALDLGWSYVGGLWGSVSTAGFWLALERYSRAALVFATGRFTAQGAGSRVQVYLQLKRWAWWSLITSAALVPLFGAVVDLASGGHHLVIIVSLLAAFVLVGNLALLRFEQRRLLRAIEGVLYAHRVPTV